MKIGLGCLLLVGMVWTENALGTTNEVATVDDTVATNNVKVAKAVEAMTVDEEEPAASQTMEAIEEAVVALHEKEEAKKEAPSSDPWEAFEPPPDSKYDWIQLTSGEWLKGDFKVMYNYVLEFDSDELDLQEFDLEDVKRLRTREMKSVLIENEGKRHDSSTLRGVLEINGDQVVPRRAEHEVKIPRDKVISIAGGKKRERDYWTGMISLGANIRRGNTDTADITIIANLKRRTAATRLNSDYISNYSQNGDGGETANNQRLSGFYDRFLTSRFYWQALAGEYYRDPFSNIYGQYSLSMGAGYDFVHSPKTEWSFTLGAGYQNQIFVSVSPGETDHSSSPFVTAGTLLDQELTGKIDYVFDYSLRFLNKDNGQYTHHMLSKISIDIISDLDLDISLIWDRIENPQRDANGNLPQQDDLQLIVGLGYDF
jgi:hypothetical protein